MRTEAERYGVNNPDLCPFLRWKGLFVSPDANEDGICHDGNFWCLYTATCMGPDGNLAEPLNCVSADRACYGKGRV